MDYKNTPQSGNSYSHMWDVDSVRVFDGGFLFDKTTVPAGTEVLPRGAFLKVDQTERKATMIKTVTLHAAVGSADTAVKIKKGSFLVATDVIGNAAKAITVGAIDSDDPDFDEITIVANSLGTAASGAVLQNYDEAGASGKVAVNPDGLNYTDVALDAQPSCSVVFEAKGIVTSRLPQVSNDTIKTALKFCQFLTV